MNATPDEGQLAVLIPELSQEQSDTTFSFLRCFSFEERTDAIWFITEVIQINKMHTTIEALADDLSQVKIMVRSDLCKLNFKMLLKAVEAIEALYYEKNAA